MIAWLLFGTSAAAQYLFARRESAVPATPPQPGTISLVPYIAVIVGYGSLFLGRPRPAYVLARRHRHRRHRADGDRARAPGGRRPRQPPALRRERGAPDRGALSLPRPELLRHHRGRRPRHDDPVPEPLRRAGARLPPRGARGHEARRARASGRRAARPGPRGRDRGAPGILRAGRVAPQAPRWADVLRRGHRHEPPRGSDHRGARRHDPGHPGAKEPRGAAHAPGLPRLPDRPGQPRPALQSRRARARPRAPRRQALRRDPARPRRLQGHQRQPRPRGGRPGPDRGRAADPVVHPRRRHRRPPRGRRIRAAARGHARRVPRDGDRAANLGRAAPADQAGGQGGVPVGQHGPGDEHARGSRGRAARKRGRCALPRQGEGQGRLRDVRAGHAHGGGPPHRARGGHAPGPRARRVPPPLPADRGPAERPDRGRGGAAALAAPATGSAPSRSSSSRSPRRAGSSSRSATGSSRRRAAARPAGCAAAPMPLHISVNLSARQLQETDLVDRVREALRAARMDPAASSSRSPRASSCSRRARSSPGCAR